MELLVQSGPDAGKVFPLSTTPQVAGRQLGAEILLNDEQVSRRHVSFQESNGTIFLTDLGSANGTQLNGQPLPQNQPQPLNPGDQIRIGATTLRVQPTPPAANQPPGWAAYPPYQAAPHSPAPAAYYNNQPQAVPGYNPNPPAYPPIPNPNNPVAAYNQGPVYDGQNFSPVAPVGFNSFGVAPAPPLAPVKKNRGGLLAGLGAIVILAIAAIVGILLLGGTNNTPATSDQPAVRSTAAPRTPVVNPVGPSGTNAPPPPPPSGRGLQNPASSLVNHPPLQISLTSVINPNALAEN